MMFNYPFFNFRNRGYPYRYYSYPYYKNNTTYYHNQDIDLPIKEEPSSDKESSSNSRFDKDTSDYLFSILGINLYFDDLIILALLFFLYTEGIKDEGLFICLILLLLS